MAASSTARAPRLRTLVAAALTLGVAACETTGVGVGVGVVVTGAADEATAAPTEVAAPEPVVETESDRFNAWLDQTYDEAVARSPQTQTRLGLKINNDQWDDRSDANALREHRIALAKRAEMRETFDYDALDAQAQLSYRLFEFNAARAERAFAFRKNDYIFNQMFGLQSALPAFLINQHRIDDRADAESYIARLHGIYDVMNVAIAQSAERFEVGVRPPPFVYDHVMRDARNLLTGAPFDDGPPNALLTDALNKIDTLNVSSPEKQRLAVETENALRQSVKPAYENLIAEMERQKALTDDRVGAWKLPRGRQYYRERLAYRTTTELTPHQIHVMGRREVARIQREMRAVMRSVQFEGTLKEFFVFMRDDPQFYFPNTEDGREAYLAEARAIIARMDARMDELFITKPDAALEVRRVEAFRERSAGKAFYSRPAPDGSRPGIYYANLFDMADMPIYQMEALAYHEAIPGHHAQNAIAQGLEGLPKFRRFGGYTAYSEGWGLYSERIPKDMGFYEDPYSDFGRLAMELWRAARLVVDTGLHAKGWSREQAVEYLLENTPNPEGDAVKAIERYIVLPGQATAYTVGKLKILELRARAEDALGPTFDAREFHEVILANGPVPLGVLEDIVDAWIVENARQ